MTMRTLLPIAVVAGIAAVAPSVAGGAAAGTWSSDATAICKRYGKQIDALPEPKSLKAAAASAMKLYGLASKQTSEIARLPRPAKDATSIAQLVGYWQQQLGVVKEMAGAMRKGDKATVQRLMAKGDGIDKKVSALGKKLGVTDCVD